MNTYEIQLDHADTRALIHLIEDRYTQEQMIFETSWSSYAITPTEIETAVTAFIDAHGLKEVDWFATLPIMLNTLAIRRRDELLEAIGDGDDEAVWQKLETHCIFLGDAMRDLAYCHLRDA